MLRIKFPEPFDGCLLEILTPIDTIEDIALNYFDDDMENPYSICITYKSDAAIYWIRFKDKVTAQDYMDDLYEQMRMK